MPKSSSMAPPIPKPFILCLIATALCGCTDMPKPDSNTQVFKTIEQTDSARRSQQLQAWKSTAIAILQEIRPNLHATAANDAFHQPPG
jgi:hypothetical protein